MSGKRWRRTRHLQLVSDVATDFITREIDAEILLLNFPPRHGKSEFCSHWLPVWILDRDPTTRIGLASYEAGVAGRFGGKVRDTLTDHPNDLRARVSRRSAARSSWVTTEGGGMITAGVGGPFTSHGFDIMIFDDLYKNWQQANSQVYKTMLKGWFKSTAFTRLEPGGLIIVPMVRWSEDDIIDVLRETGLPIKEIKLPALAVKNDQLGRKPGEALWPQRYTRDRLLRVKKAVGSLIWSAVYQQDPGPDEGAMFKRDHFRYWKRETNGEEVYVLMLPDDVKRIAASQCIRFATADLGVKDKKKADYTVFAAWALTPQNDLLLTDLLRFKKEAPDQVNLARQFFTRNRLSFLSVESVAYQYSLVALLRRGNAENPPVPTRAFNPSKHGDKIARARSAQVFQEGGQLYYPAGALWLDKFEDEILRFPDGKKDDQVDVQSGAVIEVVSGRVGSGVAADIDLELTARTSPYRI